MGLGKIPAAVPGRPASADRAGRLACPPDRLAMVVARSFVRDSRLPRPGGSPAFSASGRDPFGTEVSVSGRVLPLPQRPGELKESDRAAVKRLRDRAARATGLPTAPAHIREEGIE